MESATVLQMILYQYLCKVCYEALFTPVTYAVVNWLKRKEGIDVYDHGVKYKIVAD